MSVPRPHPQGVATPGDPHSLDHEALTILMVEHLGAELERQRLDVPPVDVGDPVTCFSGGAGLPSWQLAELGGLVMDGSIGFVTTTIGGVIEDVNESAARMFGYTRAELRGSRAADLAHPEYAVDIEAAVDELGAGRRTHYEAARIYRHRDGRKVPVRCTVRRLESSTGEPVRVIALLEDLSSRAAAIVSRLGAERARKAILETATDAFISIDAVGSVLDWNAAAVRLFGFTATEAIGQDLATLIIPPHLRPGHRHGVARVAAGGIPTIIGKSLELEARRRDGSALHIELTAWSTPSDSAGMKFHAFCRDIGERVATRQAMADANRQLDESREQLRAAFEASPTADAVIDSDGTLVEVNPALCRLLGSRPETTVGRSWLTLFPESDVTRARTALATLSATDHVTPRTEIRCSKADGTVVWGLISLIAMPGKGHLERVMLRIENIQNSKDLEVALVRQATYDATTGLPNRALFLERVRQALEPRPNPSPVAFVSVILQGLHAVIDQHGYAAGDEVLLRVAQRISADLGHDVTLAHVQPGHFALLVPGGQHDAVRLGQHLLDVLRDPVVSAGAEVMLRVGIGISAAAPGSIAAAQIGRVLQDADSAAHQAHAEGSNRIAFAGPQMRRAQERRDRMETLIRDALEHDTVAVAYQPVFELSTGDLVGAEALLRISDPEGVVVPPLDVIAVAESSGQIIEVGRRVLRLAARQSAAWFKDHHVLLPIAVNVSALQLGRPTFVDDVLDAAAEAGVPPQAISLELTESVLLEAGSVGIEQLTTLRDAGIMLAIDDFGTGYASLSYLLDLPASTLKIDRTFVDGIPHDAGAIAIVAGVIGLAQNFGMSCIAEGIETEAQRAYLAERGILGQGFLLGTPAQASRIGQILAERRTDC
jgi:PAS domain S-box-containing protein/diguanylate cyclase (GGDEF)-like protein